MGLTPPTQVEGFMGKGGWTERKGEIEDNHTTYQRCLGLINCTPPGTVFFSFISCTFSSYQFSANDAIATVTFCCLSL